MTSSLVTIQFDPSVESAVQDAHKTLSAISASFNHSANKAETTKLETKPKPKPAAKPKAETKPEPKEEAKPEAITKEQVRAALKQFSEENGKDAAIQILKDHSASSLSELKEEAYQSVIDAASLKPSEDDF
jgi:2,4-dienoyl-CoA reductase-like NADH-dependent reductase (Old Yellow Enzyme family)